MGLAEIAATREDGPDGGEISLGWLVRQRLDDHAKRMDRIDAGQTELKTGLDEVKKGQTEIRIDLAQVKTDLVEVKKGLADQKAELTGGRADLIKRMDEQKADLIKRMDEQKADLIKRMDEQKADLIKRTYSVNCVGTATSGGSAALPRRACTISSGLARTSPYAYDQTDGRAEG